MLNTFPFYHVTSECLCRKLHISTGICDYGIFLEIEVLGSYGYCRRLVYLLVIINL